MRLDKFLKTVQIIKRRTAANEAASEGFVRLNGREAKPSAHVKEGDLLEIDMWNYYKKIKIVALPSGGNIPKNRLEEFLKIIEYRGKSQGEDI